MSDCTCRRKTHWHWSKLRRLLRWLFKLFKLLRNCRGQYSCNGTVTMRLDTLNGLKWMCDFFRILTSPKLSQVGSMVAITPIWSVQKIRAKCKLNRRAMAPKIRQVTCLTIQNGACTVFLQDSWRFLVREEQNPDQTCVRHVGSNVCGWFIEMLYRT